MNASGGAPLEGPRGLVQWSAAPLGWGQKSQAGYATSLCPCLCVLFFCPLNRFCSLKFWGCCVFFLILTSD